MMMMAGWTGQRCSTDMDECAQGSCRNGATCTNVPGSYSCACTQYFSGEWHSLFPSNSLFGAFITYTHRLISDKYFQDDLSQSVNYYCYCQVIQTLITYSKCGVEHLRTQVWHCVTIQSLPQLSQPWQALKTIQNEIKLKKKTISLE